MKTGIGPPRRPGKHQLVGSKRFVIPDLSWSVYETWVDSLPERSAIRMAFDGSNLEIMTKSPDHEKFRQLLGYLVLEIAKVLHLPLSSYGEMTWKRPTISRGIEADQCYYLNRRKIEMAARTKGKGELRAASMPPPDLAIEIDISGPEIDRPGIYAAMKVAEVWRFDGEKVVIERLGRDGRYRATAASRLLRIKAVELTRWLTVEDTSDEARWAKRLASWLETRWAE
ncbi:MAG: Uma2 family endonuclease [Isosphaeraceae bacterium]